MSSNTALFMVLLLSPFFLFVFHALAVRMFSNVPGQKLLIICIGIFNAPVLLAANAVLSGGSGSVYYLYVFIVFNLFAYVYFHFFNMSETARRIKILAGVRKGGIKNLSDISAFYDYDKTLNVRLLRLVQLGQLKKDDKDNYSLDGRVLYTAAFFIVVFRKLLGFENRLDAVKIS